MKSVRTELALWAAASANAASDAVVSGHCLEVPVALHSSARWKVREVDESRFTNPQLVMRSPRYKWDPCHMRLPVCKWGLGDTRLWGISADRFCQNEQVGFAPKLIIPAEKLARAVRSFRTKSK